MTDILSALKFANESGLILDEIQHGLVSFLFCLFLYTKTKSLKYSVIPLLVTYVMDLDHWVDYLLYYGFDINITRFLGGEYFHVTKRAVVPLHAWEWCLALGYWVYREKMWKSYKAAVALGIMSHLIWDTYRIGNPLFYSMIYRIYHDFIV